MSINDLLLAMEFGYKQHEKGHNLEKARSEFMNTLKVVSKPKVKTPEEIEKQNERLRKDQMDDYWRHES